MEDLAVPRRRFARRRAPDPQELIVSTIAEHAESLLRVARRHTRCQADAEDAYQRALEIFVKSAHRLDPATVHRWLHTVVKHEAYAVGEQRARYVGVEDEGALDALDDGRAIASVEERAERQDELLRAAEALKRLKPQEVTALMLKAQGLTYQEIAERQSWTYTKVNRCITEGRKAFLARYAGIQSGEECERWLPVLSAMTDGEASAEQVVEARPHLRNCASCRAVLADMHRASAPVAALLPPALLGGATAAPGAGLLDRLGELLLGAQERIAMPVVKAQSAIEAASSMKMAAVAASTVAIAGGGVAVERQASGGDARASEPAAAAVERSASAPSTPDREPIATPPLRPDPPAATTPAEERAEPAPPKRREPARAEPAAPNAEFAAESPASGSDATPAQTTPAPATEFSRAPTTEFGPPAGEPPAPQPPEPSGDGGAEFDLGG